MSRTWSQFMPVSQSQSPRVSFWQVSSVNGNAHGHSGNGEACVSVTEYHWTDTPITSWSACSGASDSPVSLRGSRPTR